jgi:probable F420-dependent oxidoreductase
MRYWYSLQFTDTGELLELARTVERETPFHGVFLGDHVAHPVEIDSRYPNAATGRAAWPAETHWPDLGATMGALLATTTRLHVTTSIMVLPLRHPVLVAKMLSTLSHIGPGRVSAGVGVGWMQEEFAAVGVDFRTRGRRSDEMLDVLRLLWKGRPADFAGEFFRFAPMVSNPTPRAPIPLYVSGFSPAAMRRAAVKGDGWIGGDTSPERMREALPVLRSMLREAGRDPASFEIVALLRPDALDQVGRLEDEGVTSVFCYPEAARYARVPTRQDLVDDVHRYAERIERRA